MDRRRGTFIVIEGSDGSGKATQLKLIKDRLVAAGHDVETFEFPRYDQPSSYFVKRYLEGAYGGVNEVGPYTSSLFYALDRFEAAPAIRRALDSGKIVLADRFTGSNMAHQGTKIANAEQRRGFFIWLDNLEFEMLRIPRPDISFVLRVPAEVSKKLMAERQTADIHEADVLHLERTVSVFDDLTQLFPKDFQRIDCVRSGALLDIPTINTMIWEKVSPLLPTPHAKPVTEERPVDPPAPKETLRTVAPTGELEIPSASGLLIQRIERLATTARVKYPDIPAIYSPTNLVPDVEKEYKATTHTLLGLYAKLVAGLAKHGISAAEARLNAGYALPVAATATIHLSLADPQLENIIMDLMSDDLTEAQTAGANLFAQAIHLDPHRFKDVVQPVRRVAAAGVKAIAEEFLSQNHIGDQQPAQLTAVWPRNENDLIADMLYSHSSLPLRTIQDRITSWPMSRKLAVFEAYMSDPLPSVVFEKAHYSWDIVSSYVTFLELQMQPSESLEVQTLTPRYGYDIPKLIEEVDLADTFEKCFDLSLELYSGLQRAGHYVEAQYAVLRGHNQRWKMTQNALQTISMHHDKELSAEARKTTTQMAEKIAEVHPMIADSLTS